MIVALNNKSNLDYEEFKKYKEEIEKLETTCNLILCPTFLNIGLFSSDKIALGAQNVSCREPGASTGEIAAEQLSSYGVKYTIIGHSERRDYQKESLEEIHEKLKRLLENNITPILCIGESKEEREQNEVEEVLEKEFLSAIKDLTKEEQERIIIAYEPIWSIGTGIIPTSEEIEQVFRFIKNILPKNPILYGGSANETNIDQLKTIEIIDGYLLGGLSLKPEKLKIFLEKLEK